MATCADAAAAFPNKLTSMFERGGPARGGKLLAAAQGFARRLPNRWRRAGPWWLAPLLPAYIVAWLALQLGPHAATDDGPLLGYAVSLLHGHYGSLSTLNPVAYLWHGPGLPLLLAPMVWLGLPVTGMRLLTGPLLLFVAVVLFERLLRLRLGRKASLAGAYALGLYMPFGYLLRSLAKEELALVLVVIAMYATTRVLRDGRRGHVLLGGLALGGLVYDRVEFGWVAIALLIVAGVSTLTRPRRSAPRRVLAICAVAVAMCVPWLAYTEHVTGQPLYWGNSGGLSLYWMSSPSSPGYGTWFSPRTVFSDPRLAAYRPFFRHVDRLPPLQANQTLQSAAEHNIEAHPARYLLNVAANGSRMLFSAPFGFKLSSALSISYSLFTVLLLGAIGFTLRRWRRARRVLRPEAIPFAVFLVLGFGIHLFPSADPRMLMPLIPLFVWFCAQGWAPVGPQTIDASRDDHAARRHLPSRTSLRSRIALPMTRSAYPTTNPGPSSQQPARQGRARRIISRVTLMLVVVLARLGIAKPGPAEARRSAAP